MIKRIFKDAFLDTYQGLLFRQGLDEHTHLLHKFGSVPAINARIWDKYKNYCRYLGFKTNHRKFLISKELFEKVRVIHMCRTEKQYYCDSYFYDIRPNEQKELKLN